MRSVPVKLDAKMSRRAAILTGNVSKERGTSHAYIVFKQEDSAVAALGSNMHVVCRVCPLTCCKCPSWQVTGACTILMWLQLFLGTADLLSQTRTEQIIHIILCVFWLGIAMLKSKGMGVLLCA